MIGPAGQIGLIEIIRLHARKQKLMDEAHHHRRIIIYALQQHRLRAQRHAGVRQSPAGGLDLRCQLIRMIEMQVHIDRMIFLQHGAQLRSHAIGQASGDAAPDADQFQVGDSTQGL